MVALNFNAANVKPNTALEAVPSGMYPVMIVNSEEKPTKSGNGSYIQLEMQIQASPHVDPQYHGRKVFDRLNINNPNQTAVDIAYSTLSAICHVTGVLNMTDTAQLHGRPFVAVVQKKERDDKPGSGEMSNEVKGYKDMNGNDPGFSGTTQSAAPAFAQTQQKPAQATAQAAQPAAAASAPAWAGAQPAATAPAQESAPAETVVAAAQTAPASAVPSWAQK